MIYTLLSLSPLSPLRVLARLACLIHAANVHSEPESNPSIYVRITDAQSPNPKAKESDASELAIH